MAVYAETDIHRCKIHSINSLGTGKPMRSEDGTANEAYLNGGQHFDVFDSSRGPTLNPRKLPSHLPPASVLVAV